MEVIEVTDTAAADFNEGKVKWFSDQKGYGFIARTESPDVFVHYSQIQMEGFRTLHEGDGVRYQLADGPKGPHAVNVERMDS